MPELPEVQAHAERLTEALRRRRAGPLRAAHVHRPEDGAPAARAGGRPSPATVGRRGKYLLLEFAPLTFVVHLMQGGRLKADEKQSAKPRSGQARWRFEDGPRAAAHRGGQRTARPGSGASHGGRPRPVPRSTASGPEAMDVDPGRSWPRCSPRTPCASTASCATSTASPGSAGGWPTRSATGPSSRRSRRPASSARTAPQRVVDAIHAAVDDGLAYERTREDMSSSADRPGGVHQRTGEACPVCGDTIREVEYSELHRRTTAPPARPAARSWPTTPRAKFLK